ncbi:MAG: PAS domain-containing protein [Epsilonproteobacteria bacterium]|nr:PAS domain-containing protein [Campylobacterota bacterium]
MKKSKHRGLTQSITAITLLLVGISLLTYHFLESHRIEDVQQTITLKERYFTLQSSQLIDTYPNASALKHRLLHNNFFLESEYRFIRSQRARKVFFHTLGKVKQIETQENSSIETYLFREKSMIRSIHVLPVYDGFLVSIQDEPRLTIQEKHSLIIYIVFTLLLLMILFYTYHEHVAKRQLTKRDEKRNVVLNSADTVILTTNEAGIITSCNRYALTLFGYKEKELLQHSFFKLIANQDRKKAKAHFLQTQTSINSLKIELLSMNQNEKLIHVEYTIKHLESEKGFIVVANSLEDKITIEAQNKVLKEINKNLYKRVNIEVEKNIKQHQKHQQQMIENVKFTTIGKLSAGITHEINTPLTYIKGNFEMLNEDIDELPNDKHKESLKQSCHSIKDGIDRITTIIDTMHEMAQKPKQNDEKVNLYNSLITALTMTYNRTKHICDITLQGENFYLGMPKRENVYCTMGNKQRLEQVFVIIINNALDELVKHETFSKRQLSITLQIKQSDIIIQFKDNAGGIDPAILPHIFDPFQSTKESSGMGIGLNIAQKIISDHTGEINAYNKGEGAVFELHLKTKSNQLTQAA